MSSSEKPADPLPHPDQTASAEPEPFLARWSRRKSEARETPPPAATSDAAQPAKAAPAPIDPATLPPIESLTADSDFTVFLREGVPEGMRKAALQKLWRTEPSVVNYVPLVEYNWDFNAPGYGALTPTDDVAKLARQVWTGLERASDAEAAAHPASAPPEPQAAAEPPSALPPPAAAAPEPSPSEPATSPPRRHGGALPT